MATPMGMIRCGHDNRRITLTDSRPLTVTFSSTDVAPWPAPAAGIGKLERISVSITIPKKNVSRCRGTTHVSSTASHVATKYISWKSHLVMGKIAVEKRWTYVLSLHQQLTLPAWGTASALQESYSKPTRWRTWTANRARRVIVRRN